MDAQAFRDCYGRKKAESIAKKAGTTYEYFCQIARGDRTPSRKLALRLIDASGHELDFVSLLTSKKAA